MSVPPGLIGCGLMLGSTANAVPIGGLAYVGGKTFSSVGSASAMTCSLTDLTGGLAASPSQYDIVIVNVGQASTPNNADVNLTTTGYTELADLYADDLTDTNEGVYWKIMGVSPDADVTIGACGNGNACTTTIQVWRGVDQATPMDVAVTTATGIDTAKPNPPAITPVTAGAIIIVCGAAVGGTTGALSQPGSELSNFLTVSQDDTVGCSAAMGSYAWTSGAFDPVQWNGSTNVNRCWTALTLALRPQL